MRKLQQWVRAVWMFLRIVFRVWNGRRVWPVEAWQIASTVWLEELAPATRLWFWSTDRQWVDITPLDFAGALRTRRFLRGLGFCTAISRGKV